MKLLKMSVSTAKNVASCSTKVAIKTAGYSGTSPAYPLIAGKSAHKALQIYFTGGHPTLALETFKQDYEDSIRGFPKQPIDCNYERLEPYHVEKVMQRWFEKHPAYDKDFPFSVTNAEIPFEYPLGESCMACGHEKSGHIHEHDEECFCGCSCYVQLVVIGVIDLLGKVYDEANPDGVLIHIEHKTTGRIDATWKSQFKADPQNTIYQYVASQTLGEPVMYSYINAIEFSKLPSDPKRKCAKHGMVYAECGVLHANWDLFMVTRDEEETEATLKDIISLGKDYYKIITRFGTIEGASKTRTKGKFNGGCVYCEYKGWCWDTSRDITQVDNRLARYEDADRLGARSGLYEVSESDNIVIPTGEKNDTK